MHVLVVTEVDRVRAASGGVTAEREGATVASGPLSEDDGTRAKKKMMKKKIGVLEIDNGALVPVEVEHQIVSGGR